MKTFIHNSIDLEKETTLANLILLDEIKSCLDCHTKLETVKFTQWDTRVFCPDCGRDDFTGLVAFHPYDGGFRSVMTDRDFQIQFKEITDEQIAEISVLRRGKFSLDESPSWDGIWAGNYWNGWATPAFDKETYQAIIDWCNDANCLPVEEHYEIDLDKCIMRDPNQDDEWYDINTFEWEGTTYYDFDGWCWSLDEYEVTK